MHVSEQPETQTLLSLLIFSEYLFLTEVSMWGGGKGGDEGGREGGVEVSVDTEAPLPSLPSREIAQ